MSLPVALDERQKTMLSVALAVVGLWVYYAFVLGPLWTAATRTGQELQEAERALNDIEQGLVQEPQLQQQQKDLGARVAQLRAVIPTEDRLPDVVQHLTEVAAQTGIKVHSVSPQAGRATDEVTAYRPAPVNFEGLAGYHQLGMFLSRIETEGPPIHLEALRISANNKALRRQDVKMQLVASLALLSLPDESKSAPARKAKAKGKGKAKKK